MGGIAQLAVQAGLRVTGCDANVYPPMSTQLERAGIELIEGFGADQLALNPNLWVIGNAMSRGNPLVEAILDRGDAYISGPEFLARHILADKWVLAVSGTHGKTSTTSILTWILEQAGLKPGFLVGGVPANFGRTADLGGGDYFVVEADEYDTAFFDKRSKFVHYRPRTLVINNLEYDHADIFPNMAAIQRQFNHLLRTVPSSGRVIYPAGVAEIEQLLAMGCWSERQTLGAIGAAADWRWRPLVTDGSSFQLHGPADELVQVDWSLLGEHNMANAAAAVAAAAHVGVDMVTSGRALAMFKGIKRRLELVAQCDGIRIYDDFAHHPTAIRTTLAGLRARVGSEKIVAVIEPRSNTMKLGVHKDQLGDAVALADQTIWLQPDNLRWSLAGVLPASQLVVGDIASVVEAAMAAVGDTRPAHVLVMSNGGFGGVHQLLADRWNQ